MFKILIVDDEYMERAALKIMITRQFGQSFKIEEASNGIEAVQVAKAFHPDILLMDIKMPHCSGIDASYQIKQFLEDVKIIFITAYDYFDYAKDAIKLQAEDLLVKPVEVEVVNALLEKLFKKLIQQKKEEHESKALESKFNQIRKQFGLELIQNIKDPTVSFEALQNILHIMDVSFEYAVLADIHFSTSQTYQQAGIIQKNFSKNRFLEKIESKCEAKEIQVILGPLTDQIQILFLVRHTINPSLLTKKAFMQEIENILTSVMEETYTEVSYSHSPVTQTIKELKEVGCHPFSYQKALEDIYPYDLEEKLLCALEHKDFLKSREYVVSIAKVLSKVKDETVFNREVMGLYMVIKRTLRKLPHDPLMQNSEVLIQKIYTPIQMISFFERLFAHMEEHLEEEPDKNKILIQKLEAYLQENYKEDLSLKEAAAMIGFSPFYFSKLIKEHLQMTYVDYVSSVRIEKAKELLRTSSLSIAEVSEAVGYENPNYFTRIFKRWEGMTPSQYKTQYFSY